MSRSLLILAGVVCWTVAGVDALYHLYIGDLVVPVLMATAAVLWVGLRQRAQIAKRLAAIIEVEADIAA
jgi:hypothetical protein